jgi:hypothetical protein
MASYASRNVAWVLPNVVGIVVVLYFSSWIWAPAGKEHLVGGAGDGMFWGLTAGPAILVCAFIDVLWIIGIVIKALRGQGVTSLATWLFVILAWYVAYRYDASRMYDGTAVFVQYSMLSARPCFFKDLRKTVVYGKLGPAR